jgi:multiple antibiotic resistance protein
VDLFLQSFVMLFVVVDPLGVAAIFSALMKGSSPQSARRIALCACFISMGILIIFGMLGNVLLHHLGISVSAFRIAGGMLVFVTGFRMLMGFHDPDHLNSEKTAYKDRSDLAIFPLSIPLMAGPGCMTAAMLHMTSVSSLGDKGYVIAAIVTVELIALSCMLTADKLVRLFGTSGSSLMARIMGILMAAMAIQFIADGVITLFAPVIG